jgi:hypothetical protein
MNEQTALDELCDLWEEINHHNTDCETLFTEEREKAFAMAESALEKQIPKKPKKVKESQIRYTDGYICPSCSGGFTGTGIAAYCYHCGQAIDWGN